MVPSRFSEMTVVKPKPSASEPPFSVKYEPMEFTDEFFKNDVPFFSRFEQVTSNW